MLTALIAPITSIVVSTSVGVAINSAAQMIVPIGIKALPAFGIKVATAVVAGLVGVKVGNYVERQISDVVETVQTIGVQEEPSSEDN